MKNAANFSKKYLTNRKGYGIIYSVPIVFGSAVFAESADF